MSTFFAAIKKPEIKFQSFLNKISSTTAPTKRWFRSSREFNNDWMSDREKVSQFSFLDRKKINVHSRIYFPFSPLSTLLQVFVAMREIEREKARARVFGWFLDMRKIKVPFKITVTFARIVLIIMDKCIEGLQKISINIWNR